MTSSLSNSGMEYYCVESDQEIRDEFNALFTKYVLETLRNIRVRSH